MNDDFVLEDLIGRVKELEGKVKFLDKLPRAAPSVLSGVIEVAFAKTGLVDNVATGVFKIETPDTGGNGGGYVCFIQALVGHGVVVGGGTVDAAIRGWSGCYSRAVKATLINCVSSAVSEIVETASGATTPATRDIANITVTAVEVGGEEEVDVKFQVDLTGSGITTAEVICFVKLIWYGFFVPPSLGQL